MLTILPVLDIQQQHVVRGIAGRRDEYRPIVSQLTSSTAPGEVAQALADRFAFSQAYVADLDAIAGAAPNIAAWAAIRAAGLELWIDAGNQQLEIVARYGAAVLGLESLVDPEHLARGLSSLTPAQAIFSLDLFEGKPWTKAAAWQGLSAEAIAECAIELGVQRLILLDMAAVGSNAGPRTLALATRLRQRWPQVELVGGGGVRHLADLQAMEAAGFTHALVASALHDGRITPHQLA